MTRRALLVCLLLAWPVVGSAQPATSLQVTFMNGTQVAVAPFSIPFSAFTCSTTQQPPPSGTVANPTEYQVDHPDDTALPEASRRQCTYREQPGGPLLMLAYGPTVYTAVAKWQNSVGTGPASAPSNSFSRPGTVPSAPTRLRIVG